MKHLVSLVIVGLLIAPAAHADEKDGKWRGSVESNLTWINGNRKSESILFVGGMRSIRLMDRFLVDGYYNFGRQEDGTGFLQTSTDQWSFGGRYERDFGRKSFYYASGRFERDGVNLLDLRSIGGAGIGYTVYDNDLSSWRVSGGLSYVNEDYRTSNNAFWGFQAQSDYSRALVQKEDSDGKTVDVLSLVHNFTYIPSLNDGSDYYFLSNLGLRYSFSKSFSAGFRYIVSFVNRPAAGSVKQNTTYGLVFGYKF